MRKLQSGSVLYETFHKRAGGAISGGRFADITRMQVLRHQSVPFASGNTTLGPNKHINF